jgi:AcrR family transcriptional regulator
MGSTERRRYDSSGRQAEAAARRARTVEAAHRLFIERGYAGTTIAQIADEARVSPELIYASFGSKKELLLQVHQATVVGDVDEIPLAERHAARTIRKEASQERQCRLGARLAREVYERSAAIWHLIDEAAAVDPEIEPLRRERERQRFEDVRTLVEATARLGTLRYETPVAIDITYALSSPDVFLLLVEDRQWSPDDYENWLATALIDNLIPSGDAGDVSLD